MDDFGIKYIGRENLQHVYNVLRREKYTVEDLKGNLYCGISLKWDYLSHHVDLTMVQCIMKQLTKYNHFAPLKPQHCLYLPNLIKYSKDNQVPSPLDDSPLLDKVKEKLVQQIVGSFLYHARAVDPTILMALSKVSSQQAAAMENMMKCVNQFLNDMLTHPDAIIWCCASDMILNVNSDASLHQNHKAMPEVASFLAVSHAMETQFNSTEPLCHMHHPRVCCCFSSRSQTGCTIPECTRS
jgi:hypothetical protein